MPHFDYGHTIYWTVTKYALNKLQKVQTKGCRIILKADRFEWIIEMHKEVHIMTLHELSEIHMTYLCHQNTYDQDDSAYI